MFRFRSVELIKSQLRSLALSQQLGYGLTETAGACSYADGKHFRGYEPFPGTEFRIGEADTEDEVEVDGEGARGEVQVRGATLFVEYLNDEEKTKEAFTEDGWFRTG